MVLFQIALLPLAALLYGTLWLLWRYLRPIFVKSPLDNIRGPPRQSFVQGQCSLLPIAGSQADTTNGYQGT